MNSWKTCKRRQSWTSLAPPSLAEYRTSLTNHYATLPQLSTALPLPYSVLPIPKTIAMQSNIPAL
eukprot:3557648-Rhodomonas_salina.3